jgi:exopolysaccharide production protein ExoZ
MSNATELAGSLEGKTLRRVLQTEARVPATALLPTRAGAKVSSIQYLRACAALMVVFHHAREQFPQFPAPFHTTAGQAGVDLFFVISGFVMVLVTSTREHTAGEFLLSRATRIVPVYWFYTFACWLLLLAAPRLFTATEASVRHLVLSLLFVPHAIAAAPGEFSPLVKLGWTLNYEVFFYLMFTLAMFVSMRRRVALTAAMLACLLIAPRIATLFGWQIVGIGTFYTGQIIGEFALGMFIARVWFARWLDGLDVFSAVLLVIAGFAFMLIGAPAVNTARLAVFGLPAAAIVVGALALERRGAIGRHPLLLMVGDASYSLYLVQILPIALLRFLWHSLKLPVHGWPWAILFVASCMIGAVLAALVSYKMIERPSLRWLRQVLTARQRHEAA